MAEAGVPVGRREQLDLNLDSCCDELVFFFIIIFHQMHLDGIHDDPCLWLGSQVYILGIPWLLFVSFRNPLIQ